MRARADFYVSAVVRWADEELVSAYVRHRGDVERGLVMIVQVGGDQQAHLWVQSSDEFGVPCWRMRFNEPKTIEEADAFITRERERDEDLWVIELERDSSDLPGVLTPCKSER